MLILRILKTQSCILMMNQLLMAVFNKQNFVFWIIPHFIGWVNKVILWDNSVVQLFLISNSISVCGVLSLLLLLKWNFTKWHLLLNNNTYRIFLKSLIWTLVIKFSHCNISCSKKSCFTLTLKNTCGSWSEQENNRPASSAF